MTTFANKHADYKADEWEDRTPKLAFLYRGMSGVAKKLAWIEWKQHRSIACMRGDLQLSWVDWLTKYKEKYA